MYAFDQWAKEFHPDIVTAHSKRPKKKECVTLWDWLLEFHPELLKVDWPEYAYDSRGKYV